MVIATTQAGVGLLPFAWWLSVLAYAWRASMFLGHWPYYNNPDPKNLPEHFAPSTAWLDWTVPIAGLILATAALAFLLRMIPNYKVRMFTGTVLLFGGWLTGLALLWLDPGGMFEWICD